VAGQPDEQANATAPADQDFSQDFTELRGAVAQVGQLTANVRDGKVTLDPAAGAQLLAALRTHTEDITSWQGQVGELSGSLPLGNNPVGNAMGVKFSHRADGDSMSLASVLTQYQSAVADATAAIEQAMQRYASTEDDIQQNFGRISAS
jgi:hypothetical protein